MLIRSYELETRVSTHSTEEFEYEAVAHLAVDISAVLPYLNAILPRGIYVPERPSLAWRHDGHNIGFWPQRIAADDLESRDEAEQVIKDLVGLVNRTWERRDELEPDHTTHKRLQPLELFRLLPRTNCRVCGEDTCFNFALKLVAAQKKLELCTPLFESTVYLSQRTRLESILADKWPAL
jgi:ArsR family metal-binding transcriptional regulator